MEIKAAVYCRLSKEDVDKECKEQESQSIVNQTMMLLDYVKSQGFQLYDIYKDDDFSGLYDDRPGFERLIQDAKERKFDVVVAKNQARFTRNMEHLEKYLHHDFPIWGIRFIGVVDHTDTQLPGNKKARQINGLINEWYCEDLSASVRASFLIKQKNGQFLAPVAPYGYIKDEKDNHHLIPDPYAAEVVKRIFHMYLGGMGKARIGKVLDNEGILIPTEYKTQIQKLNYHNALQKYSDSAKWSFQTIDGILKNEVYIGNLVQNKARSISYKDRRKKRVPKEEWIRVEKTHEAIIDEKTFYQVQELLAKKTRPVNISENQENLFSRRLFCGDCGRPMTPVYSKVNKQGIRHRSYICGEYKKFGNKYCNSHVIREETLIEIVLSDLRKQAATILTEREKKRLKEFRCISGTQRRAENLRKLCEELKKIESYKMKAFENFADGLLSKIDYIKMREQYEEKGRQLQKEIQNCKEEKNEQTREDSFEDWIEKFADGFKKEELTRDMVRGLIDSIYIYEDKRIEINYKFSCKTEEKIS